MSTDATIDQDSADRDEAMRFLFGRIDYERARNVPYRTREFKLLRMRELLERLGNPQHGLPIVHVAGTKGKGSTTSMIGAVLTAAGYRAGVFSSPHLDGVEERMAIDGQPCPSNELVAWLKRIRPAVEAMDREAAGAAEEDEIGPTYFEITTAMALLHFDRHHVDAAVLEVGLGGRLDSTNVCLPRVSVITNISFDHTQQLGNTLTSIAREKAGIIKPGVPVVSGVTDEEPREVIRRVCRRQGCPLAELGVDFDFRYRPPRHLERAPEAGELDFDSAAAGVAWDNLPLGPLGEHQATNAAVALATLQQLRQAGWQIPEAAIRTGLSTAACPARVEVLGRRPAIVVDAAHNPAAIDALVRVLQRSFSVDRRWLIFATTEEKDCREMLRRVLGRFDRVVFTRYLENPRAVPPEELSALARELSGQSYAAYADPADAWEAVRRSAGPEDLVCVTGSFFIAAEMRRHLATEPSPLPT